MAINWTCTVTFALLTLIVYLILCEIIHNKEQDGVKRTEWWAACETLILVGAAVAYNLNQWFYPPCRM